jgi:hypothetical protein
MSTYKIHTCILRILLLTMYGIFFAVQLTTYFDHSTGSTYRLNSEVLHTSKQLKHTPDGFSNNDASGKKLTIRLNKKFYPQSAVLYTMFVSKIPVAPFTKKVGNTCIHPFVESAFLSDHTLRGPPVSA